MTTPEIKTVYRARAFRHVSLQVRVELCFLVIERLLETVGRPLRIRCLV